MLDLFPLACTKPVMAMERILDWKLGKWTRCYKPASLCTLSLTFMLHGFLHRAVRFCITHLLSKPIATCNQHPLAAHGLHSFSGSPTRLLIIHPYLHMIPRLRPLPTDHHYHYHSPHPHPLPHFFPVTSSTSIFSSSAHPFVNLLPVLET